MPEGSTRVVRGGTVRHYPRCQWNEERCEMGATYILPVPIDHAHDDPRMWSWKPMCASHYIMWQNRGNHNLKYEAAYALFPVQERRQISGAAPRPAYER